MAVTEFYGTGRRKTSTARVWLRPGDGTITVNDREVNTHFPRKTWQLKVLKPLELTGSASKYNVLMKVKGGGLTGQADACAHGLSRALVKADEANNKKPLKAADLLTRDPRMVESKKYGKRKARRGQQFSKR
ncbi:MAG: 30S ribosomal protein S9 [Candidatus Dadabacteria bacterium]|nr:30S ribosomal protein S9 [Candidatus Dadabacteria bacterium]NIS07415.1 30S ribosomal protein S9 [Candidatus Dadabacteria bacterium]NIV41605.1 30S ribosomal protein S9 [Candidatus Dadabacteria bacterium]NIX14608.1 30S ribosomal protein S9 [Candidatus Dadabacteria bacterium]NIY21071.1 30S ribosomal protein S9 [Candidatus Dadabacteria bacterium]